MACSMSNDFEGIRLVRVAAMQLKQLTGQVINAARIFASRPSSKVTQENMDAYKDAWQKAVKLLTDAVDDIIFIHDFLSVSENHILEDINRCVLSLRERDVDTLDRTAGAIRGRTARICNVVSSEMDNYEQCDYTNRVLETVSVLKDQSK
jgi:catenin alpha